MTIAGQHFGATQGTSTVKFSGTVATPSSWSDTQIVVPVPSGAASGKVQVTVNGLISNAPIFTVGTPPNISSLSPTSGPVGTIVTITGTLFGATQGTSTLKFNGTVATPSSWSDTQIVAPVPSGATGGKVQVTVNGLISNGPIFTVGNPPTISSLSPTFGPVGTAVTITGTLFGATQGTSTLKFNGTVATPSSWSDTQIVAPVPSGATGGKVQVAVNGLISNGPIFTVGNPPTISSLSPTTGPLGTVVTITGTLFGATQGTSTLNFSGTPATPTSWSDTQIVAAVSSGTPTGSGKAQVTVNGLTSNSPFFTVIAHPGIASLSPTSGSTGASVTISGTNFGATQGSSTVTFSGTTATPTSWNNTQIVAPLPPGATTGNVVVTVAGVASNPLSFTVTNPVISAASPGAGGIGATVTITGSYLGNSQGQSTVSFNGTIAAATGWSDSRVTVTVPSGATTGPLSVTVGGVTSNGFSFTVTPTPSITSVSPTTGTAGTQVTIAGSGFGNTQGSGSLLLGTRAGVVATWSDTQVVATVSNGSGSGMAQVRQSGTVSNSVSFTVITATIASVTPASGSPGTQVTITGSGFGIAQGTGQVWLGTAAGQVSSWSDGQVVASVAPGSNSGNAQILQNGIWSNPVAFTVTGIPHITSISPDTASAGTVITIQGTGFGSSQGSGIVWIGGTNALVSSWSDTQVLATVGSNAISGVLKIQQNGVWSNAVTLTVPSGFSSSGQVTLNPNVINMLVSDTRPITALDASNKPVLGLAWTSSDTTIVTLSTDDPPIITAVAPGNATITAGGASADVTVYAGSALPVGTVLWSNPGNSSGVTSIYPAVPSYTGVADVFALQNDGTLLAITSDGTVAWSAALPSNSNPLPDFQGGAVVSSSSFGTYSIFKIDGLTGQSYPAYTPTSFGTRRANFGPLGPSRQPAIHTDGTIFAFDYACSGCGDSTDGAWVVGINPSTGTAKFKVATFNSTYAPYQADSFCAAESGSTTGYDHPWLGNPKIAGDGFVYVSYVTVENTGTVKRSAAQRYPDASYPSIELYYGLLLQDTNNSNFSAALMDLGNLGQWIGITYDMSNPSSDPLVAALQNSDRTTAMNLEGPMGWQFTRLCDTSSTDLNKLHILRVGTDGTSSDVVAYQWSHRDNQVRTLTSTFPGYTTTETQVGAPAVIGFPAVSSITNADTGAVFSWRLNDLTSDYCALYMNGGCVTPANRPIENHLTTVTGGAVASDVVWGDAVPSQSGAVQPVLQLADGSFVGSVQGPTIASTMVAFDGSGNVKWTVPDYNPDIATADGGIIADPGLVCSANGCTPGPASTFNPTGNATGQLASFPRQSWRGNAYQDGDLTRVNFLPFVTTTIWSFAGGNPSGTGPGRPWYFILNWQNAFDFIPDYPSVLPNLQTDITYDATAIKTAALNALKEAYKPWSVTVTVVEGTPNTGDHQAVVQTNSLNQGPSCGSTFINVPHPVDSEIWYECNMEQAQRALLVVINNAQDETNALKRQDLIQAIGRGIGNNAAHEIAHQFLILCCSMDALTSQDPASAGTYNNGSASGSPDPQNINSDPAPYTGYGKSGKPIFWEDSTKKALGNCLGTGWHNYTIPCAFP